MAMCYHKEKASASKMSTSTNRHRCDESVNAFSVRCDGLGLSLASPLSNSREVEHATGTYLMTVIMLCSARLPYAAPRTLLPLPPFTHLTSIFDLSFPTINPFPVQPHSFFYRPSSIMSLLCILIALVGLAASAPLAATPSLTALNFCYQVSGAGSFNTHLSVDFTQTNTLPADFVTDAYTITAGQSSPYSRSFCDETLSFNDHDSLSLLVPGEQAASPIRSAEFRTSYGDILYGSVRTVAKASTASGSTHGLHNLRP